MPETQSVTLRRSLGFWALVFYGVGDILGAGIYALVGKVAGIAGTSSWIAFCVALGAASLTALSYAELGGRLPKSGGESYYCQQGFRSRSFALLVGWLVLFSGLLSTSAISHAFSGYLLDLFPGEFPLAKYFVIAAFLLMLAGINFWGIRQSSIINIICTCVEISGLLLVLFFGTLYLMRESGAVPQQPIVLDSNLNNSLFLVIQGAALSFFAFIGFEDMVNVAEEVKTPHRILPKAILTSLVIAGFVYVAVVYIATSVVSTKQLAESDAPLLEVIRQAAPGFPPVIFSIIALFAVTNTALLNSIMGSRLLYGMADQDLLPSTFRRVHSRTQTPHLGIAAYIVGGAILAYSGTMIYLASTTNFLLLIVFSCVNASLLLLKLREPTDANMFRVPLLIPALGCVLSLILAGFLPPLSLLTGLGVIVFGLFLLFVRYLKTSP